jgi:hypothetical protein
MRTSLSVNRTAIQVEPDFSTPGRSHDERATVYGKPQGGSREQQGPTSAGQIGMGLQFVRSLLREPDAANPHDTPLGRASNFMWECKSKPITLSNYSPVFFLDGLLERDSTRV